jgi:hypothetical protein
MTVIFTEGGINLKFTFGLKYPSKGSLPEEIGNRWDIMTANDESNPSSTGLGG